jgi:nucleoporin GLE1
MPARNSSDNSIAARLSRSHISTTSSAEDLSNDEAAHIAALAEAQASHQRVRESALRAYSNDVLRQEQEFIRRKQKQELERLKLESERAELAARLQELQRKKITPPTPRAPSPPPTRAPIPKQQETPSQITTSRTQSTIGQAFSGPQQDVRARPPSRQKTPPPSLEPRQNSTNETKPATIPTSPPKPSPAIQRQANTTSTTPTPSKPQINSIAAPTASIRDSASPQPFPGADKYLEIHKKLKQLRAFVEEHAKQDQGLKKKMGEMRREIRKSVGQLTEGRGANRTPVRNFQFTSIIDIDWKAR